MGYVEEESFGHVPITSIPALYGPYPIGGSGSNLSMWRADAECVSLPPTYPCKPGQKCPSGADLCPDDYPYYCGCGGVYPGAKVTYKCCKYASGDVKPGSAGYGCDCHKKGEVAPEPAPQPKEPTDAERDAQKAKQIASDVWQRYSIPIVGGVIGIALIGYFMYKRKR